ncbi:type II toxin-antitoxin system RelE/ParE family toxin [Sinorhizobium meliloti]|nr:type II toxin-antitoxin system RelE/ParE family toxin [Sinorhizobium meliloti]
MTQSFGNKETEAVFKRQRTRRFGAFQKPALVKLLMLHAATRIEDLRVPPGNRLEALKGDRAGQYSIRINQQWRICFRFENGDAYDVEISDYH